MRPSRLLALVLVLGTGGPVAAQAVADWPTAAPEEVGLDAGRLAALTAHLRDHPELNIHAVLIAKDGRLAYEQYFSGEDNDWGQPLGRVEFGPDTLHDLRSVTKSVTSALIGIAIGRGLISDLDARVVDLLPGYAAQASPAGRELRLRHLLTMTAGLAWDESLPYSDPRNSEIQMTIAKDPLAYVMGLPGVEPAGRTFQYNGGLTTLLGGILEARSGQRLEAWAREVLFAPLGITELVWHTNEAGLAMPASGLRLRPRDLAKFGWMVLDGGRWQGEQIVPEEWVQRSTEPQIRANRLTGYGLHWWTQRMRWEGAQHTIPSANGNGGQRVYLVRELGLLAVILAGSYDGGWEASRRSESILVEHVLPAAGVFDAVAPFDLGLRVLAVLAAVAAFLLVAIGVAIRHIVRRRRLRAGGPAPA
jgi:CubicO group peptidase (beta-lactamase class C family)